jgi:hypothetical protein
MMLDWPGYTESKLILGWNSYILKATIKHLVHGGIVYVLKSAFVSYYFNQLNKSILDRPGYTES